MCPQQGWVTHHSVTHIIPLFLLFYFLVFYNSQCVWITKYKFYTKSNSSKNKERVLYAEKKKKKYGEIKFEQMVRIECIKQLSLHFIFCPTGCYQCHQGTDIGSKSSECVTRSPFKLSLETLKEQHINYSAKHFLPLKAWYFYTFIIDLLFPNHSTL